MESGNSSSMQSSSGGGDEQEYESSTVSGATAGNYLLSNNSNFAQYSPSGTMSPFMFPSSMNSAIPPSTQHHQNNVASYQLQSSLFGVGGSETNYQDNLIFWQHQHQHQPQPQPHEPGGSSNNPLTTQMAGSSSCTANLIVSGTTPCPQLSPGDFGRVSPSASASATATETATKYGSSTSTSTNTGIGAVTTTVGTGAGTSSGGSNKNPRKRTRASRRAPTTVLTTDTSNFRTMVQEFTGIPSSPFSAAASPLLSRRLNDLFAAGGGGAFGAGSTSLERFLAAGGSGGVSAYNYPFRPAALKPAAHAHPSGSPSTSSTIPSMNVPFMNTDPHVAAGFLPSSSSSSLSQSLSSSLVPLRYPLTGATDLQQAGQTADQQVAGLQLISSTGGTQFHHQQQHLLRGIMNPNEQLMSFMSTTDRNIGGPGGLSQAVRLPQPSDGRSGWISREVTGSKSTDNNGINDSGNIREGSASTRE